MQTNIVELDLTYLSGEDKLLALELAKKIKNNENKSVWKPEYGQIYHSMFNSTTWMNSRLDMFRYSIGDCYRTKEDAEFAYEKLKVETELKRYIELNDTKSKWILGQHMHYLVYDRCNKNLGHSSSAHYAVQGAICFSKNLDFDKMIYTIGEDRIKKYIFGEE